MDNEPSEIMQSRIPEAVGGIQVNFCKKPTCKNFGIPASTKTQSRGRYFIAKERDPYKLNGDKRKTSITCKDCGEGTVVKSNKAIVEEYERLTSYLFRKPTDPSCPNKECLNHALGISTGKVNYSSFGKTKSGSSRYLCKACNKTFSVGTATLRQKKPHKNSEVFRLIMNKTAFKRACEIADIGMRTVFNKIDFIHEQCLAFVGNRERKLFNGEVPIKRLYLSVDCQVYTVNWSNTNDKRNIVMSAIGSADNTTGYIFGMNLNFDPSVNPKEIEKKVSATDDYQKPAAYREYARLWTYQDYIDARVRNPKRRVAEKEDGGPLRDGIESVYNDAVSREDVESFESPNATCVFRAMPTAIPL